MNPPWGQYRRNLKRDQCPNTAGDARQISFTPSRYSRAGTPGIIECSDKLSNSRSASQTALCSNKRTVLFKRRVGWLEQMSTWPFSGNGLRAYRFRPLEGNAWRSLSFDSLSHPCLKILILLVVTTANCNHYSKTIEKRQFAIKATHCTKQKGSHDQVCHEVPKKPLLINDGAKRIHQLLWSHTLGFEKLFMCVGKNIHPWHTKQWK